MGQPLVLQQINIGAISESVGSNVKLEDIKVLIEISSPSAETAQRLEEAAAQGRYAIVAPPLQFSIGCSEPLGEGSGF